MIRALAALAPAMLASVMLLPGATAAAVMTAEPTVVIQGLDKITARVSRFDSPVGQTVTFRNLSILVRHCAKSAPEERRENAAFVEIDENRPGEAKERLFSGWMFSSSPALSALEHPVYDVNLLECKGGSGSPTPAAAATPAAPSQAGKPSGKTRGKSAR